MKRQALTLLPAVVVAMSAAPFAGTAAAGPPDVLQGSVTTQIPSPPDVRFTGKAGHFEFTGQVASSSNDGALTTQGRDVYRCVIVEGKTKFHCTGRGEGTATLRGVGTGAIESRSTFTCVVVAVNEALCEGQFRLRGGSGPLDGLHLVAHFEPVRPGLTTYTGKLHLN